MKKAKLLFVMFLAALTLSCHSDKKKTVTSGETPSDIVETAYGHLIKKEYDGYIDCVQSYDSVPKRYRESLVNMLKQYLANEEKERKGIVSVSATSEQTNKKNDFSLVMLTITYGDSTKEEVAVTTVKYKGKWRLK